MKSVWEKVWLRLAIVIPMLLVVVIGLVVRCCRVHAPNLEGACYVITVKKQASQAMLPEILTLVYDENGNLLRYQKGNERIDYTYDDQGRMLTSHGHDLALDVPLKMVDYTYDEEGKLIREEGYYMMEDQNAYYCTFEYDDQGNLINQKRYMQGELFTEWIYSSNGALMAQISHKYKYKYEYTYSGTGFLREILYTRYEKNPGSINQDVYTEKTEYTYRLDGKIHIHTIKSPSEEITYDYDLNDRLIQIVTVRDRTINTESYVYDSNGNLLSYMSEYTNKKGEDSSTHGYYWGYDDQGRMTLFGQMDAEGNPSPRYTCSYDAMGNVVKFECVTEKPWSWEFEYTWPEGELPQTVKESAAAYIAEFIIPEYLQDVWPEDYLKE